MSSSGGTKNSRSKYLCPQRLIGRSSRLCSRNSWAPRLIFRVPTSNTPGKVFALSAVLRRSASGPFICQVCIKAMPLPFEWCRRHENVCQQRTWLKRSKIFSERRRRCALPTPLSRRSRCQARKQPGPKSRGPNPNRSCQGDHHPNNGRGTDQKSGRKKDPRSCKKIAPQKMAKRRDTWSWCRKAAKAPHHQKAAPQEVPPSRLCGISTVHIATEWRSVQGGVLCLSRPGQIIYARLPDLSRVVEESSRRNTKVVSKIP